MNSDYDIDVLICGTADDYVRIKKYDLYELIWAILIKDKNRYIVCFRCNFIKEDIINFKKTNYSILFSGLTFFNYLFLSIFLIINNLNFIKWL